MSNASTKTADVVARYSEPPASTSGVGMDRIHAIHGQPDPRLGGPSNWSTINVSVAAELTIELCSV